MQRTHTMNANLGDSSEAGSANSKLPRCGTGSWTHDRHSQWLDSFSESLDAASPRPLRPELEEQDGDEAQKPSSVRSAEERPLSPPDPTVSQVEVPSLDMAEQQRRVRLHRQEASRRWVERNAPPSLAASDQKHLLHILLLEANRYHHTRGSTCLNRKVADCVAMKQKGAPVPPNLRVDPTATRLTASVLNQLCFDLDWIVDNCRFGPHAALQSLEEMRLWRMQAAER